MVKFDHSRIPVKVKESKEQQMGRNSSKNILQDNQQLGPFPMESFKRVEKPTNIITEDVQRIDLRDTAYGLAARGEYGPVVQKGVQKSLPGKYPLSAAQKDIIDHIATTTQVPVAESMAPVPQDPR